MTFKQLKYIRKLTNRDVPLSYCKCCFSYLRPANNNYIKNACVVFFSTQASLSPSKYIGHIRDSLDMLYNEVKEIGQYKIYYTYGMSL